MTIKRMCVGLVVAVLVLVATSWATAQTQTRPIEDFLDAQGTMTSYVPEVPDYLGWVDGGFVNFALVDYAGLAADYIEDLTGDSVGTTFTGSVTETVLDDGRIQVRVCLKTENALAFAFEIADVDWSDPLPFLNTPLSFGQRAQDVVAGAEATLAKSSLEVVFIREGELGDDLPDLVDLAFGSEIIFLDLRVNAEGPLQDGFGDGGADGTPGRLKIRQKLEDGEWTKEIVDVRVDD